MIAAAKGYQAVITMPEKMSAEKSNTLNALGATIYRTPTGVSYDHYESHLCKLLLH
jgi:cysteine synthase